MERMLRKLVICLCSIISCFELWAVGETPYSVFGDDTEAMDIDHTKYLQTADLYMVSGDSTVAVMSILNGFLTIKGANGVVIVIDSISPSDRARYLTGDPKAVEMPHVSPYSFCYGNPAGYIDPSGQKPNEYEAALMSAAVYKDGKFNDYIKELNDKNWFVSTLKTNIIKNHPAKTDGGIQSMLFEKTENGKTEYVYAFAGTNSWQDALEDMTQLFGASPQLDRALSNAKILSDELDGKELTFVGHSLGGMLAEACSAETGYNAIGFNAASVSLFSKLFKGLGKAVNMENYVSYSYPILGVKYCVDPVTRLQDQFNMNSSGTLVKVSVSYFFSHGIDALVNALKR